MEQGKNRLSLYIYAAQLLVCKKYQVYKRNTKWLLLIKNIGLVMVLKLKPGLLCISYTMKNSHSSMFLDSYDMARCMHYLFIRKRGQMKYERYKHKQEALGEALERSRKGIWPVSVIRLGPCEYLVADGIAAEKDQVRCVFKAMRGKVMATWNKTR